MGKPKHRRGLGNKKASTSTSTSPSPSGHHHHHHHEVDKESDWVLVKKQKVTILIPPILNQLSPIPPNPTLLTHSQSPPPINTQHSVSDLHNKSLSLTPDSFPSFPPIPNLKTPDNRIRFDNARAINTYRCLATPGVRIASNSIRYRKRSFLDGNVLLNQSLRALNLERKLQRAGGGVSSWLASLGLEQFVKIFKKKSVGKFQLVNLTMKKLKDMGANAVGPRRKLMHAIDCLCQPYCFQSLQTR